MEEHEYNEIEEIAELLNYCRLDYYKLYHKEFKVASIRLRQNLQTIIDLSKKLKKKALYKRKEIEIKNLPEKTDDIFN